ncbi:MAG: 3-dehydroquinate synthase [Candidatus Neomarinimicrobiota bacterium]|nr:3-dehydroquinate synthase [Candidatus Neomarinimicrobiota bacterium]
MNKIVQVDLGKDSYSIVIGNDFVSSIKDKVGASNSTCILVTQKSIYNAFENEFSQLESIGLAIHFIDEKESAKSIDTVIGICNKMAGLGCDRSSILFAVGGGVVGDISGFVASIFMRGINYVQFPTTLLGMIDSSIGGKTGVNLDSGKNLIGRIHQPNEVVIDTSFLNTLPQKEFSASLAEAMKYGLIYDRELFDYIVHNFDDILESKDSIMLEKIIIKSCEIKSKVVSEDVDENGLRMILNFGHTIGHAIEAYFDYEKLLHGEAIVYGMKCALYLSKKMNNLSETDYNEALNALSLFALPPIDIKNQDSLIDFVKRDKKFQGSKIKFILISEIGNATISEKITLDDIKESLSAL